MISHQTKEQSKFPHTFNPKKFASELSSLESAQLRAKPSKIAEKRFIRKLRVYRKNHKYLTEDEDSEQSMKEIHSCFQGESDLELERLQHDFKRKLNPYDQPQVQEQSQGRKVIKKQNEISECEEQSKQVKEVNETVRSKENNKE